MSSSSLSPKGSAAKPYEKKKIAVFGGGGYLGATMFGFLQRAASIYGTGIAGISSPRCIGATAGSSLAVNKVLGRCFTLAYAGEELFRLTNIVDTDSVRKSVKGMDAVVLGTSYQYEVRPVTLGSYEKSPNEKTLEFYLDEKSGIEYEIVEKDEKFNLDLFQSCLECCKEEGVKHVFVLCTSPSTQNTEDYLKALQKQMIPYSLILCPSALKSSKQFSFQEGVLGELSIELISTKDEDAIKKKLIDENTLDTTLFREDIAALAVESIQSLDWEQSRVLRVRMIRERDERSIPKKVDREWCVGSEVIREKLLSLS